MTQKELCTDAISRHAAIDKIEELQMSIMRSESLIDQCKFEGLGMARGVLIELPSVSTEKTGRWNSYRNEKGDWINECSVCEQDSGVLYPYNFCPNCGAKMEVEE